MNLKEIFLKQAQLDKLFSKYIKEKNDPGFSQDPNWEDQVIIAAIIEIAEFCNEIEAFKYWKQHKKSNRDKEIEEFADAIHFLASACLHFKVNSEIEEKVVASGDLNDQTKKVFSLATNMLNNKTAENLAELFSYFLGFAKLRDWTDEMIFNAYEQKHQININRIKNNY